MAKGSGTKKKSSAKKFAGVSYARFVHKLAKKEGVSLDSKGVRAGDQIVRVLVEKIGVQAGKAVVNYAGSKTLSGKAVKSGICLIVTGDLRSGAVKAGNSAVTRLLESKAASAAVAAPAAATA
jgi:hypothetical protein